MWVGGVEVVLCESCQVCVNEIVEFVGQRRGIVVHVMWVHGVKRGGGRSVREEDRHHRQVLVTVELSFVLCKNSTKCSYSYT
jgi:hypothetical protein